MLLVTEGGGGAASPHFRAPAHHLNLHLEQQQLQPPPPRHSGQSKHTKKSIYYAVVVEESAHHEEEASGKSVTARVTYVLLGVPFGLLPLACIRARAHYY